MKNTKEDTEDSIGSTVLLCDAKTPADSIGYSEGLNRVQPTYKCIVADPPWEYGQWGKASTVSNSKNGKNWAKRHKEKPEENQKIPIPYETMTVKEIEALPVSDLAAEDCDLYLWTTQKYLPDSFGVLSSWGFRYCQTLTWCKAPRGTGQGGLYCPTTEFIILGRKGKAPKKPRQDSTWWQVKREHNKHSKKPDDFRQMIEMMSDGPRLEMFARRKPLGWDVWGNQAPTDEDIFST